ncbi:MAG: sensor histidine kinase, partial [Anaerolineae bacterium]
EAKREIFEPFNRATTMAREQGMGLGLAICRGIIDRHNGRLWIEETGPDGTTKAFSLPLT